MASQAETQNAAKAFPLRFEDGNVVIKLSAHPSGWLILHDEILKASSDYFAKWFKGAWSQIQVVQHPVTQEDVKVTVKALKFVEDTYLLEGPDYYEAPRDELTGEPVPETPFRHSGLAKYDGPSRDKGKVLEDEYNVSKAALAYRVLFAMLYRSASTQHLEDDSSREFAKITFKAICSARGAEFDGTQSLTLYHFHEAAELLMEVCAYADFYQCQYDIYSQVRDLVLGFPDLGQAIADHPTFYVAIGTRLECKDVYFDAARHLLMQTGCALYPQSWAGVGDLLSMTDEEARNIYTSGKRRLETVTAQLIKDLLKLSLARSTAHEPFVSRFQKVRITFLEKLSLGGLRSEDDRKKERWTRLAREIYSQWLVSELTSAPIYAGRDGEARVGTASTFNQTCRMLSIASAWTFPCDIFGRDAASQAVEESNVDNKRRAVRRIRDELTSIVNEAAGLIEPVFRGGTHRVLSEDGVEEISVWRGCTFGSNVDYFTNLELDETDVPWDDDDGNFNWPSEGIERPQVSLSEASAKWVDVLAAAFPTILPATVQEKENSPVEEFASKVEEASKSAKVSRAAEAYEGDQDIEGSANREPSFEDGSTW